MAALAWWETWQKRKKTKLESWNPVESPYPPTQEKGFEDALGHPTTRHRAADLVLALPRNALGLLDLPLGARQGGGVGFHPRAGETNLNRKVFVKRFHREQLPLNSQTFGNQAFNTYSWLYACMSINKNDPQ